MISGRLLTKVEYDVGTLVIQVLKARVHMKVHRKRYTDLFVKIYLKRKGKVLHKWKTLVERGNLIAFFDQTFQVYEES